MTAFRSWIAERFSADREIEDWITACMLVWCIEGIVARCLGL
jgi:hypothetical protein